MNRRNFIKSILVAGASFTILPGAGRIWKATRSPLYEINPEWINAPFNPKFLLYNMNEERWYEIEGLFRKALDAPSL